MAAETNVLSQSIGALDNGITGAPAPAIVAAGKGAKSYLYEIDDYCAVGATAIQSAGSYYRLLRVPTNALIKSLVIGTDKALDSNGSNTLAFDIGIAFSDSVFDGTGQQFLGLIPTTANDGATMTTFAAYSSPNKLFGGITAANMGNSAKYLSANLWLNGSGATYPATSIWSKQLWELFGFVDGRGYPMNPGGMFDIYAYATTGAATGVAGNLYAKCQFVMPMA